MADEKPRQTLTEAFQTILNLLPFHSEGQKNEVAETLNTEVVEPLGRNRVEPGVQKNETPDPQQSDAKNENPFPTGGTATTDTTGSNGETTASKAE